MSSHKNRQTTARSEAGIQGKCFKIATISIAVISTLSFTAYLLTAQLLSHEPLAVYNCSQNDQAVIFEDPQLQSFEPTGLTLEYGSRCHAFAIISGHFWLIFKKENIIHILNKWFEHVRSIMDIEDPRLIHEAKNGDCFVIGQCSLWLINGNNSSLLETDFLYTDISSLGNEMYILSDTNENAVDYVAKIIVYSFSSDKSGKWKKESDIILSQQPPHYAEKEPACFEIDDLSMVVNIHSENQTRFYISFRDRSIFEYHKNGKVIRKIFADESFKLGNLQLVGSFWPSNTIVIIAVMNSEFYNCIFLYNPQLQRWKKYTYFKHDSDYKIISSAVDLEHHKVWLFVKKYSSGYYTFIQYQFGITP